MDEENDGAPDAVIEVTTDNADSDTPVVETGDTTVIVETPVEESGESLDPFTERFVKLESRVEVIEQRLYEKADVDTVIAIADDAAEQALETALDVDVEIVAATDDAIVESIEEAELEDIDGDGDDEMVVDEIAPVSARVHPLFRSMSDWRNK